MSCRICTAPTYQVLDLGACPPANSLLTAPGRAQASYPLVLEVCDACGNVQLRDTLAADVLYRDYLYVTPRSAMLEAHYEYLLAYLLGNGYVAADSIVVEAGSNAGNFLEHVRSRVGSVLGVDPAERICEMANAAGIPTICDYFTTSSVAAIRAEHGPADLVVARHCLAHNESPHEMVDAAAALLAEGGYFVIENAYLLNTIESGEFDQIYHEHMFYFSIRSMKALLDLHGMRLVDVTMSLIHGGSIIFVAAPGRADSLPDAVEIHEARERLVLTADAFARFAARASETRDHLHRLVTRLVADDKSIYTYGATAKGNTLLNYVGITSEQVPYCIDSTPMKQGLFLPGSNIRVISEDDGLRHPPDYFLLTAWNYQDEIITKVREGGNYRSKFIVPIPFVRVI